jgi:hypothetical protein
MTNSYPTAQSPLWGKTLPPESGRFSRWTLFQTLAGYIVERQDFETLSTQKVGPFPTYAEAAAARHELIRQNPEA